MSAPLAKRVTAVAMRPKLKLTPAPVERTRVGNSSGKHSGSQPKYTPLTNPSTATQKRNHRSVGTSHQNTYCAIKRDVRLTRKYVVRRPSVLAIQPPSKLPIMPVSARV